VPPAIKREFCNHALTVRKTITFGKPEIEAVNARGLTLPDHAIVLFCIQCWSVNPTVEESDLDKARAKMEESNGT
jgi:hypothetical protein